MHFQSIDRVINMEFGYWDETIQRWHEDGLPQNLKKIKSGYQDKMVKEYNNRDYPLGINIIAKNYGVDIFIVDSDGLIDELIPLFLEAEINCVLPVEIAAGNDPVTWRKKYGKNLRLIGGIDKRALARGEKTVEEELKDKVPYLISEGGYIPTVDHLVPPDVSFDNYKYYLELKKKIL